MDPDQQLAIDDAIVSGRVIAAIALYREATGTSLKDAKDAIFARQAALEARPGTGVSVTSAEPMTPRPAPSADGVGLRTRVIAALVLFAVTVLVFALIRTRGFGLLSIVREPYYARITAFIAQEPTFQRELGSPIVTLDDQTWCSSITDSNIENDADCTIPVRGPRGSGAVHVQVQDDTRGLSVNLSLNSGDRTIQANFTE